MSAVVVCVLGPPRSGTSLTARALNLLGVDLGPEEHLRRAVPQRPLWECPRIVEINDRLLAKLGGEALAPPLPEPGWEHAADLAEERADARRLIEEAFAGVPLWGWKDPRTCITLPFWQRLVPGLRYAICLRHPLDSIESTLRHVPGSREQMLRTWLAYVASALVNTHGSERAFVPYERYFADLGGQLERLCGIAGLPHPPERGAVRRVEEFLEPRLWSHRTPLERGLDDPDVADTVTPLYLALEALGAAPGPPPELGRALNLYAGRLLAGLLP